jgi:predicted nucleotidyltransferase
VAVSRIVRHHQPRRRLSQIIEADRQDAVERDLLQLCELFQRHGIDLNQAGVTGSLLIGMQQHGSDIDLICYSRESFHQCRALIEKLIEQNHLQALHDDAWLESFQRRSCDLSFAEYVWHEKRKFNKALINGRKFDLNFIDSEADSVPVSYQKLGSMTLRCQIIDDAAAFDYPAEFKIAHEQITTVVCFTATYTGQAFKGERVEVSGLLEQSEQGDLRIVVGATREAQGEYIKVVHD